MFSDPLGSIYLYDWSGEPADRPPDNGALNIRDLTSTPRVVVRDSGTNDFNIPTFRDGIGELTAFPPNTPLMMDQDGFMAFVPVGSAYDKWLDVGADPAELIWVQDDAVKRQGLVVGIGTFDGSAGQLTLLRVPFMIVEASAVDLNTGTKTDLFTVPTGRTLAIDYWLVRGASASLTTVQFSGGFNANADDVIATATYAELTGSTLYSPGYPKKGAKLGAAGDVFGAKCSVVQGSAATVTIEVYGHYVS